MASTLQIFCAYASVDVHFYEALYCHLAQMRRTDGVKLFHVQNIQAGIDLMAELEQRFRNADIITLLVSADFLASDLYFGGLLEEAMTRHKSGSCRIVPIIIRPADWCDAPFGRVKPLPRDGRPVVMWPQQDDAWLDVVTGLRAVIQALHRRRSNGRTPRQTEVRTADAPAKRVQYMVVVKARIGELSKQSIIDLLAEIQVEALDSSIEIIAIEPGSVRLIVQGTREGFIRISVAYAEGRLTQLRGYPVEAIKKMAIDGTPARRLVGIHPWQGVLLRYVDADDDDNTL